MIIIQNYLFSRKHKRMNYRHCSSVQSAANYGLIDKKLEMTTLPKIVAFGE